MWPPPNPFLGVTKRVGYIDKPVTQIELDDPVYSGVKLTSLLEGMVPVYEEHAARNERGISIETWGSMPLFEKAMVIALRRVGIAMANLQSEAEGRHLEKKAKRPRKR